MGLVCYSANQSKYRLPFLPDEKGVELIRAGKSVYPSPFKECRNAPIHLEDEIELKGEVVECYMGVWHGVKKITIVATMAIYISEGAVLNAPQIKLEAPEIYLSDGNQSIQTSIIGHLEINAKYLEIDHVNVLPLTGGKIASDHFWRRGSPMLAKALHRSNSSSLEK